MRAITGLFETAQGHTNGLSIVDNAVFYFGKDDEGNLSVKAKVNQVSYKDADALASGKQGEKFADTFDDVQNEEFYEATVTAFLSMLAAKYGGEVVEIG